ncbi:hypothetical protein CC86DRAFT_134499 [Ophiobolus disseminans]|uniref:Uncharacterized protein n=1 Tax=Ophiobolus disseminans TaxID=1469910 RepID=A0A6A7ADV5_9PLEO|nr:hypothetical protein CC86DRAFT_134499 [Ophiobolus disseminans]
MMVLHSNDRYEGILDLALMRQYTHLHLQKRNEPTSSPTKSTRPQSRGMRYFLAAFAPIYLGSYLGFQILSQEVSTCSISQSNSSVRNSGQPFRSHRDGKIPQRPDAAIIIAAAVPDLIHTTPPHPSSSITRQDHPKSPPSSHHHTQQHTQRRTTARHVYRPQVRLTSQTHALGPERAGAGNVGSRCDRLCCG